MLALAVPKDMDSSQVSNTTMGISDPPAPTAEALYQQGLRFLASFTETVSDIPNRIVQSTTALPWASQNQDSKEVHEKSKRKDSFDLDEKADAPLFSHIRKKVLMAAHNSEQLQGRLHERMSGLQFLDLDTVTWRSLLQVPVGISKPPPIYHFSGVTIAHGRPNRASEDGYLLPAQNQPKTQEEQEGQSDLRNQTMHAQGCDRMRCQRIRWDKDSYEKCKRPRAVKIKRRQGAAEKLTYVTANRKTMAISHVWSHGQGGRPEEGINTCLYDWYCKIAEHWDFQCVSFWIDAACIPDDHTLRQEAILDINEIFAKAGKVLIIDRGIMGVRRDRWDESRMRTLLLETWETSAWNKRAWTLLEGIRGSRELYLLCAGDRTIGVQHLIDIVSKTRGGISKTELNLATIFNRPDRSHSFSLEYAGILLAGRTASRERDIAVIWSLLCREICKDRIFYDMTEFIYHVACESGIRTCFLMSSMPRIELGGFRWAPAAAHVEAPNFVYEFPKYDASELAKCRKGSVALRGLWMVCELNTESDWFGDLTLVREKSVDLSAYLRRGHRFVLLQAKDAKDKRPRACISNLRQMTGNQVGVSESRRSLTKGWRAASRLVALCSRLEPSMPNDDLYIWEGLCTVEGGSTTGQEWQSRFKPKRITLL